MFTQGLYTSKSTPNSQGNRLSLKASVRTGAKAKQKIVRHAGIAMGDDEWVRLKELA